MFKSLLVTPAYGRDYLTEEQARKAWDDGKDFLCYGTSSYVNKEDAEKAGLTEVRIKFRRKTLLAVVKVG